MATINSELRKTLTFLIFGLRGQPVGKYYWRYVQDEQRGIPLDASCVGLTNILTHAYNHVPYYREKMQGLGNAYRYDPETYLSRLPLLTKDHIRDCFDQLKSDDLSERKFMYNTSGGSTGVPVRFVQDFDFAAQAGAVKMLFSWLIGKDVGESDVYLWGSERDIVDGKENWRARLITWLNNTVFVNAFRMTDEAMRRFISLVNKRRPKLIVAYAEPLYAMAEFAEREHLQVTPQQAVICSAGMLYPFMREKIERVFGCRVYNRYGSREVGDIACERPGLDGLWVAPWANYVEIVDEQGRRVPDGVEGEIVITSLINYGMPLIRYRIGDRGVLLPRKMKPGEPNGQILQKLLGRNVDVFKTSSGSLVYGGYFMTLLFFKPWVNKYQVIQKGLKHIVFKIVSKGVDVDPAELEEITRDTHLLFGSDCQVDFEFVEDIPVTGSGKYRYTICEVA